MFKQKQYLSIFQDSATSLILLGTGEKDKVSGMLGTEDLVNVEKLFFLITPQNECILESAYLSVSVYPSVYKILAWVLSRIQWQL